MKQAGLFAKRALVVAVVIMAVGFVLAFVNGASMGPSQLAVVAADFVRGVWDVGAALFTFGSEFGKELQ